MWTFLLILSVITVLTKGGWTSLWDYPFYGLILTPEDRVRIHEEIFHLVYNSNGGFTHDEVYSMPIYLRYFNLRFLLKQKEQEKEASEKQQDSKSVSPKPGPSKILPRRSSK